MVEGINYLAVVLAALSTMVVGSIWYTPKVFGNLWMDLAKLDQKELEKNGLKPILIALALSFVTAYALASFSVIAHSYFDGEYSFLISSLLTAFFAWLGFNATRIVTHDSFEGRRKKLSLLTITHEFITFSLMALIIGLFGI